MLTPRPQSRHRLIERRTHLTRLAALFACAVAGRPAAALRVERESAEDRDRGLRGSRTVEAVLVHVQDGDSFIARTPDGATMAVRLSGIDAPERSQPWSDASRRHLRALLEGRVLRIERLKQDVYGRSVARVRVEAAEGAVIDVSRSLLQAGLAWHFVRYAAEQPAAERDGDSQAERAARTRGLGLWSDPEPLPPWEFRARQRRVRSESGSVQR